MLCEMCGKEVALTSRVRVEGTVLGVCPDCEKFGQRLDPPPAAASSPARAAVPFGTPATRTTLSGRRMEERDLYTEIGELELAPDWPSRVRKAREAMGWSPEDLGKKLNEKKSVVLKLESGGIHPPDALVRKTERVLKTRLRADPAPTA
ncbi:MAG TPA: multiprotein-bridging factor 1 family protein [Thermoplasmata archaeon]|nr:multiprotein-bridging factor 1 family protein [Thermoplasmata archaeon]